MRFQANVMLPIKSANTRKSEVDLPLSAALPLHLRQW